MIDTTKKPDPQKADGAGTAAEKGFFPWFRRMWGVHPLFSIALVLLVMIILQTIALGFDYPSFGVWFTAWIRNWVNILLNNASVGIIALGMTFVIISSGIDLSVGSSLVAIGAVVMILIDSGPNGLLRAVGITGMPAYIIAIAAGVLFGLLLGELNGVLVTWGKIPPFIVTLGTMEIFRSVTQQCMQGNTPAVPAPFLQIAGLDCGGLMLMPIIYWILIAVALHLVFQRTPFGRHVVAVGSNEKAAKLSGINVSKVKRWVYSLTGILVAFSAILQVSRIGSMDYANAGSGYEMDAIAAAIVGGTNMAGGRGSIVGTIFGMLIIAVMNNLLNLLGVPPFLREAFKGFIVICAVLLQRKDAD